MELSQKRITVALASSELKAVKLSYGKCDAFSPAMRVLCSLLDAAEALAQPLLQ